MKSKLSFLLGAAWSLVLGCGSDAFSRGSSCNETTPKAHATAAIASSSGTGGAGGDTGGGPPSDVTGTIVYDFVSESGVQKVAQPAADITAYAPVPGGFMRIHGAVSPDGSFVVPSVPDGVFALEEKGAETTFVVSDRRRLDLGVDVAHRPDTRHVGSPANMTLNLDGLEPWASGDSLSLFVLGSSTVGDLTQGTNPPNLGDTTLNGLTVDTTMFAENNRIEGSKGDKAYVLQGGLRFANGFNYTTIEKVFVPKPFDQEDGATTTLDGTFEDVPQTNVTFDWRLSEFVGWTGAVNSNAFFIQAHIDVAPIPGGLARSIPDVPPMLSLEYDAGFDSVLELSLGDPFPSNWTPVATVTTLFAMFLLLPGGNSSTEIFARMGTTAPLTELLNGPIHPVITPPENLLLNDVPGEQPQTGVGTAPKLAWSPPAIGNAEAYVVTIYANNLTDMGFHSAATIVTNETALRVPPGVIAGGGAYYWSVEAHSHADIAAPHHALLGDSFATAVAAPFAP